MNIPILESAQGTHVFIGGKSYLNMCSNNYLGLANEPRIKKSAINSIKQYGVGTTSVRPLIGTNILHIQLEKQLAGFKKTEDALVLTGGYLANLAVVQTLLSKEDIIVSDEYNHASIIDAIRLSQVRNKFIYSHNNINHLKSLLPQINKLQKIPKNDGTYPKTMIISDGVFSMDGDIANVPQLVTIAKQIGAILVIDDAHGEGVLGNHGRGIVDHFGLHNQVDIEVGTLSKAFGVIGGFITGKKQLIDQLRKARQFLFTNGLTIPDTAALVESVNILTESDERVRQLWQNATLLKNGLKNLGFNIGESQTPITPVIVGEESSAQYLAKSLFDEGIIVSAITFPMVEKGKARLRLIPSSLHTQADIETVITTLKKVGSEYALK